jgi:hypothetical protein
MANVSPCRPRRACTDFVALVLLTGLLAACASSGQRSLRDGTLRPGIGQKAVLTEWGLPERTLAVVSEDQLRRRWGSVPTDPLFRGRLPMDLWMYEKHGVELVFDKGDLVGWKTDRTVEQLRALPQPQTSAEPYPASGGQQSLQLGLLRVDIGRKAFRAQWGEPDRIVPVISLQDLEGRWGPEVRGSLLEGRRELDIWNYQKYGVELLFDDGDLAAWKTEKTVEELRAIPTRR